LELWEEVVIVITMFLVTSITMLRERTGGTLEAISYALPLTYAYDALARAASGRSFGARG
jgi:hypothetical protein